ncbi:hypothetical protein GZ78_19700 [Endozoicomonas numazuensis]|uniref:Uncharacterized protein n=1 Tax=Endozoicomonas numazuensis TaxID=1137799 RepID=A0A081NEK9_9GAMM|nr:hypothetical protein GZ78_19700 [Endozoicomonas numazuensis]
MPKVWNHLKFQYRQKAHPPGESDLPLEITPRFDLDLPLTFESAHITKSLNKSRIFWANYTHWISRCY